IIGLTTIDYPYAPYLKPLVATDPVTSAQEYAKILRPQVDVLILLSHNLFESNVQMGRAVPGVDLIVSGHSHFKAAQARMADNAGRKVPVVETGEWGRFLGEVRLLVDKKHKAVTFKSYQLHPVSSDLVEDSKVADMVRIEDDRLKQYYGSDPN